MKKFEVIIGLALAAVTVGTPSSADAQQAALNEFRAGQTGQFSSRGHPKSSTLHINLRYPRSWTVAEGTRPNVMQNFLAADGTGANCSILVRPLSGMTEAKAAQLLHPDNVLQLVPPGFTYRSGSRTTLGGKPAAQIIVERPAQGTTSPRHVPLVLNMTIHRNHLVSLTCGVGSRDLGRARQRLSAYLPLFQLVKASLEFRN